MGHFVPIVSVSTDCRAFIFIPPKQIGIVGTGVLDGPNIINSLPCSTQLIPQTLFFFFQRDKSATLFQLSTFNFLSNRFNLNKIFRSDSVLYTEEKNLRRSSAVASCVVVVKCDIQIIAEVIESVTLKMWQTLFCHSAGADVIE